MTEIPQPPKRVLVRSSRALPGVAVSEPIGNPAATTTGAGAAAVIAWIYNDVLVAKYGLVPMPEAVVVILAVLVVDAVRFWMTKRAVIVEPIEEEANSP